MHKQQADQIITSFMEKIFGFALTKTLNTDKAQELAARITFDVYTSLLKTDHVHNMDGYIYRISSNVYARFVDEAVRGRHISLDNVHVSAAGDFTLDVEKNETYHRLRQQVSYLGKLQREIVVMHYFDGLKQSEIARRLQLPQGTVKWHLHEARNQLKGGFQMNEKQHANLHLSPIRLTHMGSSGNPMPGKGTDFYLSKLIAQNIAYAAYWQPKTISEIAEAIGVPAAFIEDEVAYLEAHSFLDKLAGGKYQT
ncbi:MAG: RNA polymerase sigma factor, partial [Defluviitaleaceae bacterium]|nr:RNA polymerase sigma factor [Defluviitaleaceae bacterium]